jgi:phosphoglycerate dehydrogenase-like enzyme
MATTRVLFAAPEKAWGGILDRFKAALPNIEFVAAGFNPTSLAGFDVVIPTMSTIDRSLIETADRLKLIQQVGAGLEGVDLDAARERDIAVANVPTDVSGNADSVAELVIYYLIALARRTPEHGVQISQRRLGVPVGQSLHGKRVGLVGFGAISQAVSRRLAPFGVSQCAIKRTSDAALQQQFGLEWLGGKDQLEQLLAESDFTVLCLPDEADSHHMINEHTLAAMKPGAFLVNVGRGGLVDRAALLAALVSGQLAGAALDVFWEEPPDPNDPVFAQNVLASPHVAGVTDRSLAGIFKVAANNIERLVQGQPVNHRRV